MESTNVQEDMEVPDVSGLSMKKMTSYRSPGELTLNATLSSENMLKISVAAKEKDHCPPADIVAVLDISGSMGNSAAGRNDGTTVYVDLGFSLLDLLKHATKTIIKTMRPEDRLAIIQFDDRQDLILPFTPMSPENQDKAVQMVDGLQTRGATDIYGAIKLAIDVVQARDNGLRNPQIMFFTDGQSNRVPRQGTIAALKEQKDKLKLCCPINTYGFGMYNQLNSRELCAIAKEFESMNGYIPDCTNIGTTFVNSIANMLTTAAIDVKLDLGSSINALKKEHFIGDFHELWDAGKERAEIEIGSVRYGQPIEILIHLDPTQAPDIDIAAINDMALRYESHGEKFGTVMAGPIVVGVQPQEMLPTLLRFKAMDLMSRMESDYMDHWDELKVELVEFIKTWREKGLTDATSDGILKNLEDQVSETMVKQKYMQKWGEHQLRQLVRSLNMQVKNNFRDPAVQNFGGDMFNDFADKADDIYNNMDPPVPSRLSQEKQQAAQPMTAQVFSQSCNQAGSSGGGCFSSNSMIKMVNGSNKLISEIQKGDMIATLDGSAKVNCVIQFASQNGKAKLCQIGGLQITHKHPIQVQGNWVYPGDIVEAREMTCDAVYSMVIDSNHVAIVNEVPVILLGHNYTTGILKDEYLGSDRVVQDLKQMPGWSEGLIKLNPGCFKTVGKNKRAQLVYNGETAVKI